MAKSNQLDMAVRAVKYSEGYLWCGKCEEYKEVKAFYKSNMQPSNFGYRYYCKVCEYDKEGQSEYYKERSRKLKQSYVDMLGGQCVICGYNRTPAALDFHHVEPETKKYNIATISNNKLKEQDVLEEINKCCLLCANCHREYESGYLCVEFTKVELGYRAITYEMRLN